MNLSISIIRPKTVGILAKFLRPLADENLITVPELQEIILQLKHLAEKGREMPPIDPRLINQEEACAMLSISLAHFKKFERENRLPFKRKMIGTSVRYRNLDVLAFIMSCEDLSSEFPIEEETPQRKPRKPRQAAAEKTVLLTGPAPACDPQSQ